MCNEALETDLLTYGDPTIREEQQQKEKKAENIPFESEIKATTDPTAERGVGYY